MDTDRNIKKIGLVNLAALLVVGGALALLAFYANSATGLVGGAFLGLGLLVGAISYFQMRLEARERLERLEYQELKKAPGTGALFTEAEETFPAQRSRAQFEKYFIPLFSIVFLILAGAASWLLWKWIPADEGATGDRAAITMALSSLFALIFFLLGKYSAGIARLEKERLLRPAASYLLLGALLGLAVAATQAADWFKAPRVDFYTARTISVLLGLVALEILINLVLEIYRPRLKGQPVRLLYESRLIGLLSQPGGLITTAAQALDYQFGFKVSETWFYQFLEKALAWLILLQLSALWLSTIFVIIRPQEQAILERFGKPVGDAVLEPGLHFKFPWPIDEAHVFSSRLIHTIYVGFTPDKDREQERTLVWTKQHYKEEFDLLVASREAGGNTDTNTAGADRVVPVNLLAVNIPVQYCIRDLKKWVYGHTDPARVLENLADREVVRYLINVDINDIMGEGRLAAAATLRQRLQERAAPLGAEIVFVGLQGIHPPVKVAEAFEEVVGAIQEKQTNILAAQSYWAEKIPQAIAEATNIISKTNDVGLAKIKVAEAEAGQFKKQLTAYQSAPRVYQQRAYLETLVSATREARKYVLGVTNTQDVIWLNLEDKIRPDLLNIGVSDKK
jgi:HflK protein